MKRYLTQLSIAALLVAGTFTTASSQTMTAMDFQTNDCNGNPVHLFGDLDNGSAVVLFYYMRSCGTCPPPAREIQTMANNINAKYPGKVKAYAFPFENTTDCAYSKSWVANNNLSLYTPMEKGAAGVAHYGGFGMPSVVLLGGKDHRVLFVTKAYDTKDTTIMRDSILGLLGVTNVSELPSNISDLDIYPNPSSTTVAVSLDLKEASDVRIDILNLVGQQTGITASYKAIIGTVRSDLNTSNLANGTYILRIQTNGYNINRSLHVVH